MLAPNLALFAFFIHLTGGTPAHLQGQHADHALVSQSAGSSRTATRCVYVNDVFTYLRDDPQLPAAVAALERIRASDPAQGSFLERGQRKGSIDVTEVISLKVDLRSLTCFDRSANGAWSSRPGNGADGSLKPEQGDCNYSGCAAPISPEAWGRMPPGSQVTTSACIGTPPFDSGVDFDVARYERRKDGMWVMKSYSSGRRAECPSPPFRVPG